MKEFTYSEARQRLSEVLERAGREGAVRIRRRDGRIFVLRPEQRSGSPLEVPGLELAIPSAEIVAAVHEGRRLPSIPRPNKSLQPPSPASRGGSRRPRRAARG